MAKLTKALVNRPLVAGGNLLVRAPVVAVTRFNSLVQIDSELVAYSKAISAGSAPNLGQRVTAKERALLDASRPNSERISER